MILRTLNAPILSKRAWDKARTMGPRLQNTIHSPLNQKICFLHIDKCGGTSITNAIKACYRSFDLSRDFKLVHVKAIPSFLASKMMTGETDFSKESEDDENIFKFREKILLYYMADHENLLVSGHFAYSETVYQAFHDQYAFVTLLREPVSRWISSYFYNRYKKWNHRKIEMTIDEYADSQLGRSHGYEYVKFLAGLDRDFSTCTGESIEAAKTNLKKFDVVGLIEDQEAFKSQFFDKFGKKLNIQYLNRSPKASSDRDDVITEDLLQKIQEICRPDLEIYEFAKSLQ